MYFSANVTLVFSLLSQSVLSCRKASFWQHLFQIQEGCGFRASATVFTLSISKFVLQQLRESAPPDRIVFLLVRLLLPLPNHRFGSPFPSRFIFNSPRVIAPIGGLLIALICSRTGEIFYFLNSHFEVSSFSLTEELCYTPQEFVIH